MSFEQQIREASHVALFLDFDGTLAPLVPRPADAALPEATRAALEKLVASPTYTVAFVSGRAAADLEQRAPFPKAIYAGNHGLEIRGAGLQFAIPEDALLRSTVQELQRALKGMEGVEVEDKGLSASVHFRRVPPGEWPQVEKAVRRTVPLELNLRPGKMVFEVRPAAVWNKGSAVLWILDALQLWDACAVYIGDDLTDEDAFAVLPQGVTIHVGSIETTCAKYRLCDTTDVSQLLERFAHDQ